jgi:hypothetical protein
MSYPTPDTSSQSFKVIPLPWFKSQFLVIFRRNGAQIVFTVMVYSGEKELKLGITGLIVIFGLESVNSGSSR